MPRKTKAAQPAANTHTGDDETLAAVLDACHKAGELSQALTDAYRWEHEQGYQDEDDLACIRVLLDELKTMLGTLDCDRLPPRVATTLAKLRKALPSGIWRTDSADHINPIIGPIKRWHVAVVEWEQAGLPQEDVQAPVPGIDRTDLNLLCAMKQLGAVGRTCSTTHSAIALLAYDR